VQEQMQRSDIDQWKEARVIGVHSPFLVASASLDASGGKNAINVVVHGLEHQDFDTAGVNQMAAFLQVRQGGDSEPIRADQFALSVIDVGSNFVTFRIKRLDTSGGWGQQLKIQILFVQVVID
jgi:hypothetical protein